MVEDTESNNTRFTIEAALVLARSSQLEHADVAGGADRQLVGQPGDPPRLRRKAVDGHCVCVLHNGQKWWWWSERDETAAAAEDLAC